MRLIELAANQKTFRTVRFNPTGLSLVVGKKSDPSDISREHSTNGVGKSLLLYLVSFCLGSKKNKELKEKLPGWEFKLTFELNGNEHVVTRSTENQGQVVLDGKSESLSKYTDEILGSTLFGLPEDRIKYLTFRSLIGLFLRVGKPAYIAEDQIANSETPYARQLRSSRLLGLDVMLADRKRELREEHERLDSIRKQFKKDSLLRDYFEGDRDVTLELADLNEEIEKLRDQASSFRVADNYEQIAREAAENRKAWKSARNDLNSMQSSIRQIEASLNEEPDLPVDVVRQMYDSVNVELPDAVQRQLDEVIAFHQELIQSRARRLTGEKHEIERRIEEVRANIDSLNRKKDDYYNFLGKHGALQEYEALHKRLSDCQRRADRLSEYQRLEQECKERSQQNKLEMSQENIRTSEYLKASAAHTSVINERFRDMAKRIWPNHSCGLLVKNNEGENKIRFDIDARIQGDASDGISESKIFCFDMTVLVGQSHHNMKFLMHDNRIYPGIDPRQRVELFRIAREVANHFGIQYIASLNEDNLEAMQEVMGEEEFTETFTANTILELTDDSDHGKLLGITVDLHYDNPKNRDD